MVPSGPAHGNAITHGSALSSSTLGANRQAVPNGGSVRVTSDEGWSRSATRTPHLRALPSMHRCSYAKVIAASRPELPVWRVLLGRVAAGAADIRSAAHRYQVGDPCTAWFRSSGR